MKTYDLNVPLPEGVNMDRPRTITINRIEQYYIDVHVTYGDFCGDCKFFNADAKCTKGYRPRRYNMILGSYEFVHIRKDCSSFELGESNTEIDEDAIKRNIAASLDCNAQQYGG